MKIPDLFKEAIEDTFYDKKMEIWSSGTITDDEGSVVGNGKLDFIEKLSGNFQYKTREKIQQEYGQEVQANAIVTCEKTKAIEGNILIYQEKEYEIKSKIPCDSHIKLLVYGSGVNG